jgi:hypothetical protein
MALVQVQEVMIDAQILEHRGATEAQDDFLAQALLKIADVEPGGDASVPGIVDFDIRVHQIEGNTPDGDLPHRDMDGRIGQRHLTMRCRPSLSITLEIGAASRLMDSTRFSCQPSSRICCRK